MCENRERLEFQFLLLFSCPIVYLFWLLICLVSKVENENNISQIVGIGESCDQVVTGCLKYRGGSKYQTFEMRIHSDTKWFLTKNVWFFEWFLT